MAQPNSNANIKISANAAGEVKGSTVFHDFLGKGCGPDSSPAAAGTVRPPLEASPVASASLGVSSGGGCGPFSTTSDMCSGPETSFRFSGSKRCSSDSIMVSCKDRFPAMQSDSVATSHVMKLLRSAGGERPRGPNNEEPSRGVHPMRLLSSSPMGARTYANTSKWDQVPIKAAATLQYPPHASQAVPFGYQAPPNRFRDTNAGPSVISQAAADEGSRTGIKGSGTLRTINTSAGMSDRTLSGVPLSGCKQSFGILSSEPESSNPSQQGVGCSGPSGCQMTIFYSGQAHVFDDVHPNKADLIMALAGSNGGSWSTTYAPKSAARRSSEKNSVPAGENETGIGSGSAVLRELQRRSSLGVGSSRAFGSGDQNFLPPGIHQGGAMTKETSTAVQIAEALNEEKNDV